MMEMEEFEAKEKAEFNSAITALNRLNTCLAICTSSRITLDTNTWFHACMAVWSELSPYCSDAESEEFMKAASAINSILYRGMKCRPGTRIPVDNNLYWMIDSFEKKLRKISHAHGLDMKMKEDRRFGL